MLTDSGSRSNVSNAENVQTRKNIDQLANRAIRPLIEHNQMAFEATIPPEKTIPAPTNKRPLQAQALLAIQQDLELEFHDIKARAYQDISKDTDDEDRQRLKKAFTLIQELETMLTTVRDENPDNEPEPAMSEEPEKDRDRDNKNLPAIVYTDGSCLGNPGPGGYAAIVLRENEEPIRIIGKKAKTTNNAMELTGVIRGIKATPGNAHIEVKTDSQYITKAFNENWISGWTRRNWHTAKGTPVLNKSLWVELIDLTKERQITFTWVKAHANDQRNNEADELASDQAKEARSDLQNA